jgi:hypothetical protein
VSGTGAFRLKAGINAWLEEISFRAGMIAGAVILVAVAAVGAIVAVLAGSGHAAGAPDALGTANSAAVAPAASRAAHQHGTPSPGTRARSAPAATSRSAPAGGTHPSASGSGPAGAGAGAVDTPGGTTADDAAPHGRLSGPVVPASGRVGGGLGHSFPPGWAPREGAWGPSLGGPHFLGPRR